MSMYLDQIEIFNFKSFRGKLRFGPLKRFIAIVGPNGAGKSNIMDAIGFVMGEKTSNLRVKQLNELIYGMPTGKPVSCNAYVKAIFKLKNDDEISFTRAINGNSCIYKINDQVVSAQAYLSKLSLYGLNTKAMNFLVFQGMVESIIMKTPKEKTQMIEEISRSSELKAEYERLKEELLQAETEVRYINEKRKCFLLTKKGALLEREEAEKYESLNTRYLTVKSMLQLFELYHIRKDIDDITEQENEKILVINMRENDKALVIDLLKQKKIEAGALSREIEQIEEDLAVMETSFKKRQKKFLVLEEEISYWQRKSSFANNLLTEAQIAKQAHEKTIKDLKNELLQLGELKIALEDSMATQLISQSSVELNNAQVQEYFQLKAIVQQQCSEYMQSIDAINQKQQAEQNKLDNNERKRAELEIKLRKKKTMKEEAEKGFRKLQQGVKETEEALAEKTRIKQNLESRIIDSRGKIESLQQEYSNVCKQLGDAKLDNHMVSYLKKKADTLNILQQFIPGVYDRLSEMCKPIHPRYNIAITKVFGKHMDAIVVTTNKVARDCISYLKEQQIGAETFLPLDSLQCPPLKEKLRSIRNPKNVKLLYDILTFSPAEINNAILFVSKNILICETPEDARTVAYELDRNRRYDSISLDGTFYRKGGIISGGQVELLKQAKVWEEQQLSELKLRKIQLTEEIKEVSKVSQLESELNAVDMQINGLSTKWKYMKYSLTDTEKQVTTLSTELEIIEGELHSICDTIETVKLGMQEQNQCIETIERKINGIADIIFFHFCQNIGTANIRQYEQGKLRVYEEQMKKKLELEEHYNRIQSLLDYEINRDTESAVTKNQEAVQIAEEKLKMLRQNQSRFKTTMDIENHTLQEKQALYQMTKMKLTQIEKSIEECRHHLAVISRSIQEAEREHIITLNQKERKKAECHAILKNAKAEGLAIPTVSQNRESSNTFTESDLSDKEIFSQINFDSLPENMKSRVDKNIYNFEAQLKTEIIDIQNEMALIVNPNFKAADKLSSTLEEIQKSNREFQDARKKANELKASFDKLKHERYKRFANCFDRISAKLDHIYKSLVSDRSAQAILLPENAEEPYLGGINYSCIAPGKSYHPMSNFSGGEKTLAALAFLFAIHSVKPAPIFVLDEVDAPLDNLNIKNVVRFIRSRLDTTQFLIITLKKELFSHAEVLSGVCSQPDGDGRESLIFTLALTDYHPRVKK